MKAKIANEIRDLLCRTLRDAADDKHIAAANYRKGARTAKFGSDHFNTCMEGAQIIISVACELEALALAIDRRDPAQFDVVLARLSI